MSKLNIQNNLLTPDEVALILKVTSEQVRCLIRKGQLSAINVGIGKKRPLYRITEQALTDFLNIRKNSDKNNYTRKFKKLDQSPDFFPELS